MFGRERRVLLKDYLDQGLSKTAIAERLGISRRTVYHWITTGQLERDLDEVHYRPRPPVPTKLDPPTSRCPAPSKPNEDGVLQVWYRVIAR